MINRFRAGTHVQRRVGTRESSLGGCVQAAPGRLARHSLEFVEKTTSDRTQDGHRHGPSDRHVQAHVAASRAQDHGRDQESDRLGRHRPRELPESHDRAPEHVALRRSQQHNQAARDLSHVDQPLDGRVLRPGRSRAFAGPRDKRHVRSTQCKHREISGKY